MALERVPELIERLIIVASQAVEAIASWGTNWRDVALAERAAKEAAVAAAEEAANDATAAREALEAWVADDANTDAEQITAALAEYEQAAVDRLEQLKAGDPATETPDPATEPPAEGDPVDEPAAEAPEEVAPETNVEENP